MRHRSRFARPFRSTLLVVSVAIATGCNAGPVDPDGGVRLEVAGGEAQIGIPGVSLPDSVVVRVTDGGGRPIAQRAVSWEVLRGDGSVEPTSITDESGRAMALWTLGAAGPQSVTASVRGERITFSATAEAAEPGSVYAGRRGYVEYYPGTLPIVISAPHGGTMAPSEIPDRTEGTFVRDTNTRELALAIADAFEARTGGRPHVIVMRLHRRKLDANREPVEAAQGNALALQAWSEFHGYIEHAKSRAMTEHGLGFYIDLHGHSHSVQRLELGYVVTGAELALPDAQLNAPSIRAGSSIRVLAEQTPSGFVELLRGTNALGTLLEQAGVPAVPSAQQPDPGGEPYFSGGYNTDRHSVWGVGLTAGVQIECHFSGIRDSAAARAAFGATLAAALEQFIAAHYAVDLRRAASPRLSARTP